MKNPFNPEQDITLCTAAEVKKLSQAEYINYLEEQLLGRTLAVYRCKACDCVQGRLDRFQTYCEDCQEVIAREDPANEPSSFLNALKICQPRQENSDPHAELMYQLSAQAWEDKR